MALHLLKHCISSLKGRVLDNSFQIVGSRFYRPDVSKHGTSGGTGTKVIDLRSDTVTRPSMNMRAAMASAEVGDDVYGEDPTVNALQKSVASLFGKEAALFVPSGTMGNLIGVLSHCRSRGEEIILGHKCHLLLYEQGGVAQIGGVHPRTVWNQKDGTMNLDDLAGAIRDEDPHYPRTRLICLENTHNACGGKVLPRAYLSDVRALATENGIGVHLDGARFCNALAEYDDDPKDVAACFDSISICLSKGLGAPVGSLLVGSQDLISFGIRLRKVLGGGMRQAGVIAAAGQIAIDSGRKRLNEDHKHAKMLASCIADLSSPLVSIDPTTVHSNIVISDVNTNLVDPGKILERLAAVDEEFPIPVRAGGMSASDIRFVTHVDVSLEDIDYAMEKITKTIKELEISLKSK